MAYYCPFPPFSLTRNYMDWGQCPLRHRQMGADSVVAVGYSSYSRIEPAFCLLAQIDHYSSRVHLHSTVVHSDGNYSGLYLEDSEVSLVSNHRNLPPHFPRQLASWARFSITIQPRHLSDSTKGWILAITWQQSIPQVEWNFSSRVKLGKSAPAPGVPATCV